MENAKIHYTTGKLKISLPLTQPTGKIRIKERTFFGDYGIPFASRQEKLGINNYIEWQIGYDLEATVDNQCKTSLNEYSFINYKGIRKFAYELSELLFYSAKMRLISDEEIKTLYKQISSISETGTIEQMETMAISRTNPMPTVLNGLDFYKMIVQYPLLVHKFGKYDIYAEILVREKQRAVGTQAMLYLCLPITSLHFKECPLGRILQAKETADWVIENNEAKLALELFRIFGMLSPKHRFDVLAILRMLFPYLQSI